MGAKLDAMKAAAAKPMPAVKPAAKTKPMPPALMPVMPAPVVSAPAQAEPQLERPKQQQTRPRPEASAAERKVARREQVRADVRRARRGERHVGRHAGGPASRSRTADLFWEGQRALRSLLQAR